MGHCYHHALSSVKKWGGTAEDYLPLHQWFDEPSKLIVADFRHRALSPCRDRRHCKLFTRYTGDFQEPTGLEREILDAPHEELLQPLRDTGQRGVRSRPQRPLPLAPDD